MWFEYISQEVEIRALWALWRPLWGVKVRRWALVGVDWVMWYEYMSQEYEILALWVLWKPLRGVTVGRIFWLRQKQGLFVINLRGMWQAVWSAWGPIFQMRTLWVLFGMFCANLRGSGAKFSGVDMGGLGSVFMCIPERSRFTGWSWGRDFVPCGWLDVCKVLEDHCTVFAFLKAGSLLRFYQNIVDFLCRVLEACLCIYLLLWKLSESFCKIVNFLLCLFDVWFLLGILALLVSKLCLILFCSVFFVRCFKEQGDISSCSLGWRSPRWGVGGLHGWGELVA